jgi:hypothetical protein
MYQDLGAHGRKLYGDIYFLRISQIMAMTGGGGEL